MCIHVRLKTLKDVNETKFHFSSTTPPSFGGRRSLIAISALRFLHRYHFCLYKDKPFLARFYMLIGYILSLDQRHSDRDVHLLLLAKTYMLSLHLDQRLFERNSQREIL